MGCCAGRSQNAASCCSSWTVPAVWCQHCEWCDPVLIGNAANSFLTPGTALSKPTKLHVAKRCDADVLRVLPMTHSAVDMSCATQMMTW